MGDRANVKITENYDSGEGSSVYLYTHWGGSELHATVAAALASEAGRSRVMDSSYLARIIFEEMIKDAASEETGFGISAEPAGDAGFIIEVLCARDGTYVFPGFTRGDNPQMTVDEFIARYGVKS